MVCAGRAQILPTKVPNTVRGRGQQHAELHKGVLADDLIRPNRLIASVFQPPHGRTLQIGLRGAGERDRQANAHRP